MNNNGSNYGNYCNILNNLRWNTFFTADTCKKFLRMLSDVITAGAGQDFLKILTQEQSNLITGNVNLQKTSLYSIVDVREDISIELRKFLSGEPADSVTILSLSGDYGKYDGEIIYLYATSFSQVYKSLNQEQRAQLEKLANDLGYIDPPGAFLYSQPMSMPLIENTDYFFK